jgi:WD40 repeat protein
LILESEIDGSELHFHIAYWGLGQENYYYKSIKKLPYQEIVKDSAKTRALAWKKIRDQLLALGENAEDVRKMGGDKASNLELLEKEERWKAAGVDVSQLSLDYQVTLEDFEKLCRVLIDCHCLIASWVADTYHLIYRDVSPLLPELLPSLIKEAEDPTLVQAIATGYEQIYQALEAERKYWIPELALKFAQSFAHLSDRSWSSRQLEYSLNSWLHLHQIPLVEGEEILEAMKPAATEVDRDYLEKLKIYFATIGDAANTEKTQELLGSLTSKRMLQPPNHWDSHSIPAYTWKNKLKTANLIHTLTGHSGKVSSIAISHDGQTLVSGCLDTTIKVWNLQTGELIYTLTGHSKDVSSVAISPNGKFLASSSFHCPKNNVKVWNLQTKKLVHARLGHKKSVRFVSIDSEARILVSGSNKIKLWDLHTGDRLCTLWHSGSVNAAVVSPNGQLLISGSSDGKIKLWNPRTGEPLRTLTGHSEAVNSIAISGDGQNLVSGSSDHTIKLWDLPSGKLQATLTGHAGSVNSVAMSINGGTIATGSADQTIKIWDLGVGAVQQTLTGHSGAVNSVAISPDGQTLVSGSSDKTIRIWQVPR